MSSNSAFAPFGALAIILVEFHHIGRKQQFDSLSSLLDVYEKDAFELKKKLS